MKIEIKSRFDAHIIVSGDYESIKDCLEENRGADLRGADLRGAYLRGAYLRDAYLRGADLRGAYLRDAYLGGADLRDADLRGAKGYQDSHDVFKEAVRRLKVEAITDIEWAAIGVIVVHLPCWDTIKKRFGGVMGHVFEILANEGFPEWLDKWNEINGQVK